MYNLLIRLMFVAALVEFGISLSHVHDCQSRACLKEIEASSRDVLRVSWRPISIFPAEAERFRR